MAESFELKCTDLNATCINFIIYQKWRIKNVEFELQDALPWDANWFTICALLANRKKIIELIVKFLTSCFNPFLLFETNQIIEPLLLLFNMVNRQHESFLKFIPAFSRFRKQQYKNPISKLLSISSVPYFFLYLNKIWHPHNYCSSTSRTRYLAVFRLIWKHSFCFTAFISTATMSRMQLQSTIIFGLILNW